MRNLKITFRITTFPFSYVFHRNGTKTLAIEGACDAFTVSVWYDLEQRPLFLRSEAKIGDKVEIVLLDYRIELYLNGELKDEEWPDGNRLFDLGDTVTPDADLHISEFLKKEPLLPNVLATFENAEGWRPQNGVFVGDCMPYRKNDEYHVLYLKDRHHHGSKWGLGAHQWEHISTTDFQTWRIHPTAIPISAPWEGSICTGSWIQNGKTEFLYYTVRRGKGLPAPICRSVSADGYHFVKDPNFGFTVSEKYHAASARDPKVIKGDDGIFHMFLTTSLIREKRGCLAHFVSQDLEDWKELDDPIYIAPGEQQPECPDYVKYNGRYYLIFSLGGKGHYMMSDKPFTDFRMPNAPMIPCASVPKCAEWNGRLIFTGFRGQGGYGGCMTFKAATASENGELIFADF